MTARGRFISLEGAEGAGKTTAMEGVRRVLTARGVRVVATREPGGTAIAEKIRALLLEHHGETLAPLAETMLIFAARAQHVAEVVEPTLRRGDWVLCDRFTDSTFAYQVGARGVQTDVVAWLAERVHGHCWPDLTLYLDVPAGIGLARAKNRAAAAAPVDRIEQEPIVFFERVRAAYLRLAATHARIVTIDASRDVASVRRDVEAAVGRFVA